MRTGDAPASFGRRDLVAAVVLATALALWLAWPAFAPGRIINYDAPRHLLRSAVVAGQFLPSGHVDGWSPWWYLGAQLFLFQSYGYFLLIGASALALAPIVSLELVFKAWYAAPLVVLPAATAWMARGLGLAPEGAAFAALAVLCFSSPLGFGTHGLFGMGLLLQAVGVVGFALAWPRVLAVLVGAARPWGAALLVGAVVLGHFITGACLLAAAGLVAFFLALRDRSPSALLRYLSLAAAALMLAIHALGPSLLWHDLGGAVVGWGSDPDRWKRFATGELFGARPLGLVALAAAAVALFRGPRPVAVTAAVYLATGLIGGSTRGDWEPAFFSRIVDPVVRPRSLPYAALFQAFFVGVAAQGLLGALPRLAGGFARDRASSLRRPAALLLAAAMMAVAWPELSQQRGFVRTESAISPRRRAPYTELVHWLVTHVKPPQVIAVPRFLFPREVVGSRSLLSFLNLDTGLYTLWGDQAELVRGAGRAASVDLDRLHVRPSRAAGVLREAGVTHVVVGSKQARAGLARSRDFRLVHAWDPPPERRLRGGTPVATPGFAIYRVNGSGDWLHGRDLVVEAMRHRPERIEWDVVTTGPDATRPVTASVRWHPDWKARADGRPVPVRAGGTDRVAFDVPAGTSRVELEFERGAFEKACNAASALTLAALVAAWLRTRRAGPGAVPPAT